MDLGISKLYERSSAVGQLRDCVNESDLHDMSGTNIASSSQPQLAIDTGLCLFL